MPPTGTPGERADVELRVPADSVYVSVLRTTTASLSARLDFTIDDIEDLRIAVGEACALVLPEADPGTDLVAEYFLGNARLTVRVSVSGSDIGTPDYDSFAWQVLDTLAGNAAAAVADGRFAVTLSMESEAVSARL
jgi:serine/threonine-protein kinase RsbW